ncbi:P-loop containing nucleoside triphosphate hydrolase protein [Fusarium redolens]|uniref:P-loop containing nucleoside triphosphate hydrolase protein n=1 Tax=Fusarium redolens TaxID=48865 RepID=A0A9P9G320_FUSRE|nr:P-loop containing nucleoside triphosphate hydrolase protein [Fusarium redolens]KAH7231616.1 P-loop containing nucleoside triphosphate hydrolase protein [Fusarium redolens]
MHYLPFSRNRNLVGRENVIAKLKRLLFTDLDSQRVALVGLGGIGKSQIALELAYLIKNDIQSHEHRSVIWMPALSLASFEQACTTIINKFGIKYASDEDPKETFRKFLSSDKAGKWFLIIDNADDISVLYRSEQQPGGIADFLPYNDDGRILFTTRSQEVAVHVAQNNVVEIPEMDRTEARALLHKSLIKKDQMQNTALIDELLHELTHLPLAIMQASAYINTTKILIKQYLQLLQNTDQDRVELLSHGFHDGSHYRSAQGAVATTWVVSFNQIRDMDKDALKLLSFAAYIEPKAIPRTLLPELGSEQKMTHAIGTLCGYNFFSQREGSDTLDIHSLVHLMTRVWNEAQGLRKEMQQMVLARVAEVFPTDEWENRHLWRQYLPHAIKLLATEWSAEDKASCKLGFWVGRCLLVEGRVRESMARLEGVLTYQETILAENHPDRLASQQDLARAYLANGQVKKAVGLLEHVLTIRKVIFAEDDLDRLLSQQELAGAYLADGQIKKAVELQQHVVAMRQNILAEDHPDQLASQHHLARAYLADGQIKKAVELQQHVVAMRQNILAEDHPDQLASQHHLARAYLADGQIKKAVELQQHVVAMRQNILAEDHPDQLASQHHLARAYLADGQISEAVELLEYVVAVRETTLAENHPDRLSSQHELAEAYQANDRGRVSNTDETSTPLNHPTSGVSPDARQLFDKVASSSLFDDGTRIVRFIHGKPGSQTTFFDRFRIGLEKRVGQRIDWSPFPPISRPCLPSEYKVVWKP